MKHCRFCDKEVIVGTAEPDSVVCIDCVYKHYAELNNPDAAGVDLLMPWEEGGKVYYVERGSGRLKDDYALLLECVEFYSNGFNDNGKGARKVLEIIREGHRTKYPPVSEL